MDLNKNIGKGGGLNRRSPCTGGRRTRRSKADIRKNFFYASKELEFRGGTVTGLPGYSKDVSVKRSTTVEFYRSLSKHVHVLQLPLYLNHIDPNLFCSLSERLITSRPI